MPGALPQTKAQPALDRSIGLFEATTIVAGIILGASIFVQPSEISRHIPSIPGMLAVWVLAGLLTVCGALVCAELTSAFPTTGGVYVFLHKTISPSVGFLWGWAMFWTMHSGIIAATTVVFARYAGYFTRLDDTGVRWVAIGAILVLSAINYVGVRQGSAVQAALTAAKVAAVALILVLAFALGSGAALTQRAAPAILPSIRSFSLALGAGLFAFGGWHMVTYAAGETKDARKTIPRALLIGTLTVTACYLGLNAAYLYVLPLNQMIASTRVAADAASLVLGPGAAAAVSGLVMVSAFGAANGIVLAGPRVYFAMAEDGLLFRWAAAVHPRFHTPHRAIVLQAIWSSVLVATGTYRDLFTRVVYTEWIFFALMTIGLMRMRRAAGYAPSYRLWGYPVVPLLFVAASTMVVYNQIAADPVNGAAGLLLVATGIPVYMLWARHGARNKERL